MSWIKLDDGLPEHPSWVGATDAAIGAWVRAATYSARRKLDGNVPAPYVVREIPKRVREELLERGRLHAPGEACGDCLSTALKEGAAVIPTHFYVHAYLELNPSETGKAAKKEAARHRMEELRAERRNGAHAGV